MKRHCFGWLGWIACLSLGHASDVKPSRAEAWSPVETLKSIELEGDYAVQLVAAEPLLFDPVELCWDAKGECYVADMLDYPLGGPDGNPISRVLKLVDADGDGVYDQSVVFADAMDHVQGLAPHRDGLVVTTRTQILFLKDADGDGVAEIRKPLVAGFNPSFSQLQVSSPRWGLDGHLYFNNGIDSREVYPVVEDGKEGEKLNIARDNLRWNPLTGELHPTGGVGQFGASFDDWGRHYYSTNRNPVILSVVPRELNLRGGATYSQTIVPFGPASRIYPFQVTHTTSDAHSGTNTSSCGLVVYRGSLMPELRGNYFVCDPTGQLVTRFRSPSEQGSSLVSERIGEFTEFFRSRDEWCRPVNLSVGPDGAIYICDIYRQYIDHARFFPDDFVAKNDMRSGEHHGRIWKVIPKKALDPASGVKVPKIEAAPETLEGLVAWLSHANAWQRETAQRLLIEKSEDLSVAKSILTLISEASSKEPLSDEFKVHALWTFSHILHHRFNPSDLQALNLDLNRFGRLFQKETRSEILENALIAMMRYPEVFEGFRDPLLKVSMQHGNTRVRMLAYGTSSRTVEPDQALKTVLEHPEDLQDPWFQSALMDHLNGVLGQFLAGLIQSDWTQEATDSKILFIRLLSSEVAAREDADNFNALVQTLGREPGTLSWWKSAVLQGLAAGLPQSNGDVAGKSLQAWLGTPREGQEAIQLEIPQLLAKLDQLLLDESVALDVKLASIPLIATRPLEVSSAVFKALLKGNQPPELSHLALQTLKRYGVEAIAPLLYETLPNAGPGIRRDIVVTLMSNGNTLVPLLEKMVAGEVPSSLVEAEARWGLLQNKTEPIQTLANRLFQQPIGDRAKLVDTYLSSTQKKGDSAKGRELFAMYCAICHSFQGQGIAVGPDITDVRAKEKPALLVDILDPNRMIEARWSANRVTLKDQRTLIGLVESETAQEVVLKMPGGVSEKISREEIVTFEALDTSLMPVGLEAGISVEQMSDLLSYLRGE